MEGRMYFSDHDASINWVFVSSIMICRMVVDLNG